VMVDSRNMESKRPSKKLDHKKIGPFRITKLVGKRACRVELPGRVKVHPTFHVSMLELYRTSDVPGRQQQPPEPDEIDGEESWVIQEVVDSRKFGTGRNARVKYLTLWEGYPPSDATWEPWESFEGTGVSKLAEYHRRYPQAVQDHRVRL